jgi:(p)ppGpp synthase/HD superfamily hydrolase
MTIMDVAIKIATEAHAGQKRKNGEPYINHAKRVSSSLNNDEDKIAAWLHDVLEDTQVTISNLRDNGIPESVITVVRFLTRKKDQNYYDFITCIIDCGPISAVRVKIADIEDNLNDLNEGSMKDKYRFALLLLKENLSKRG